MKKTAIVTGSSRGIGFAIARQLGLDGYNIVMVATGAQEKNQHALDALQALGIDCTYVQANIGCTDAAPGSLGLKLEKFSKSVKRENKPVFCTWATCSSERMPRRCSMARAPSAEP